MALTIRPYQEGDAHAVAELYNRHRDNPNPVAGGITGAELDRELAERETATFLVAEDDQRLVGTFGLFHHTGRRSARAGELIADMFFVHPAHRGGMVTGRLFTEAVEWMMRSGCLVLRLTVNPANTVAFRLYRRVGCVSVGRAVPGEDGNVELHNYIPLVLRSVFADLGERATAALGSLSSFASVTESRDDELRSDVRMADGVRVVDYCLTLGECRLDASVDVDRGAVREARLTEPGGEARALRTAQPPYRVRTARGIAPYRFTAGALSCEVDGEEGTVSVFADGHLGPVLVSTWPSCRADRPAGWREGEPRDLTLEPVDGGVRVTEHHGDDTVTGTVTLDDTGLLQEFTHSGSAVGRVFHTVGLRQGVFTDATGAPHPIGLGLGVRDASEIVAASQAVPAGRRLTWRGGGVRVALPIGDGRDRLVHSTLLERGREPGADGVTRLRTEVGVRRVDGGPGVGGLGAGTGLRRADAGSGVAGPGTEFGLPHEPGTDGVAGARAEIGPSRADTARQPEVRAGAGTARQPEVPDGAATPRRPEVCAGADTPRRPEAPDGAAAPRRPEVCAGADTARRPEAPAGAAAPRQPEAPAGAGTARQPEVCAGADTPRRPEAPAGALTARQPEAPAGAPTPRRPELPADAATPRRLDVHAAAGGVTLWEEGGTKVLRSPYPRSRSYAHNPRWSAGLWVARENSRHDRAAGLGWGVPSAGDWEEKQPYGLSHPDTGLSWEIGAADGGIRVDVRAPDTGRESVLWLTPHAPVRTAVVLESADRSWELTTGDFRRVWARRASVRLSDGRWLHCAPAASPHDELVLRATPSGLLIGGVSAAQESAWLLSVHDSALTS